MTGYSCDVGMLMFLSSFQVGREQGEVEPGVRGEVCVRDIQDGRKPRGRWIHPPEGSQVSTMVISKEFMISNSKFIHFPTKRILLRSNALAYAITETFGESVNVKEINRAARYK